MPFRNSILKTKSFTISSTTTRSALLQPATAAKLSTSFLLQTSTATARRFRTDQSASSATQETTPPQFNVDLRYSRFIDLNERYRLEVFGEFQNLFNINSIVQFNNVTVTTNTSTGELIGGLPDFKARNQSTSQDSRQFQLGFKFIF